MLRTSSYTIYVDLPGNKEEMLLAHGYSGAYDKVSRRIATYVRSLEARKPPKPLYGDWTPEPMLEGQPVLAPSEQSIEVLKRRGYLTEMSPDEEEEHFAQFVGRLHDRNVRQMPSYIVMPTYNCNLRCSYCFQDHMRTDQRLSHLLRTIRPEVVDRVFAAMKNIEDLHGVTGEDRHRNIGLFGGEPLLEENRPIVGYILDKAFQEGTATLWAITNGTDLHVYRDLLSPDKISAVQITIDGPAAEHDARRIYADGSGSYERIARNIDMALSLGVAVSIRLNVDRGNIDQLPILAEDFCRRGWDQHPKLSVYTAPIRAENEKTDARSTFNTWELDQALDDMRPGFPALEVIGRPDDAITNNARKLFSQPSKGFPNFRESFCSAHTRMYIFDAFQDIYACWDRTGDPTIRIGRVAEDGNVTLNTEVNTLWRSRTVASNPACRKCRYALHCGGGCAILALGKTGKYHSNFCDGFASRFRAAIAQAYIDHVSGVQIADKGSPICDQ